MAMAEIYNFEVSQGNFDNLVLKNSYKLPVFCLFMRTSVGDCIALERKMAVFAKDFAGQFVLARIDIDMETELAEKYAIKNLPIIKVIKDGEVVHQELGLLTDEELEELFKTYGIYHQSDEIRLEAREKHLAGDTNGAIQLLTTAINNDPKNTRIAMDMVQIMLDINLIEEARSLFNRLPDKDKETELGRSLIGILTFKDLASKTVGKVELLHRVDGNPDDFDAKFDLAICLVAEHAYQMAAEQLFNILAKNVDFREGAARELVVSIINMLEGNNVQLAQDFRKQLSSLLAE
jgi:putative thioredoxin